MGRSGARWLHDVRATFQRFNAEPEEIVDTADDDVAPEVRAQSDRAYLHELSRLIELGATKPDGTAGFSLEVRHLTPEGADATNDLSFAILEAERAGRQRRHHGARVDDGTRKNDDTIGDHLERSGPRGPVRRNANR